MARAAEVVVTHGRGSYLYSDTGPRLLDAISGYGVASLGHSHPKWVDAVVAQAKRLATTSLYTYELAAYLEALANVLPPRMTGIALSSTGAEAVEMALRLAQTATGRPGVLTFTGAFHGKTAGVRYLSTAQSDEARTLGPTWQRTAPFPACCDHDAVDYRLCDEPVEGETAAIAARDDLQDIGAVLVEPVLGTAGNIPPKLAFLPALRDLCDERNWLLIFDEAITGFGRTGNLFASTTFLTEPDIFVLSKGLGGGFPLSAVAARQELWTESALSKPSATSSSYGANPIACVAGTAALEIVTDPQFLNQVRSVGRHASERLRKMAASSREVAWPRGVGLMLGFDLIDADTRKLASQPRCEAVFRECRDRGVLVAVNVPRVRINPPLTITTEEIDILFDVLEDVLE